MHNPFLSLCLHHIAKIPLAKSSCMAKLRVRVAGIIQQRMQEVINKLRHTAIVNNSLEPLLFGKPETLKQTKIFWGMKYQEGHM